MRVLFVTYPERTHFLAMAPLAWALRTAGHDVCVASQPHFADTITQAGLTAVPVGGARDLHRLLDRDENYFRLGLNGLPVPYDSAEWSADDTTWSYLLDGYQIQVPMWHRVSNVPLVPDLVRFAHAWRPDLVIWEPSTWAGAVAATVCGAAHARMIFSLDVFGVTRQRFLRRRAEQPTEQRSDPLGDWLAAYGRQYGFEFDETLVTGQFTISLTPPTLSMSADLSYVRVRHTPYAGVSTLPAWLRTPPARPRVAITMGISAADAAGGVVDLPDVLESLADLDLDVVATLPATAIDGVGRVPDNATILPWVPLDALAPTCAAVVHHGGFGTLMTVARHARPQLIVPWNFDGPALARRMAANGAALALHPFQGSGRPVRDRLLRLLNEPKFEAAAQAFRDEIHAMPTPNDIVADLEQRAAIGRTAGSA